MVVICGGMFDVCLVQKACKHVHTYVLFDTFFKIHILQYSSKTWDKKKTKSQNAYVYVQLVAQKMKQVSFLENMPTH